MKKSKSWRCKPSAELMKILVTGSGGYIGRNLTPLIEENDHTIISYNLTEGHDIMDATKVMEASEGCDAIIHLAALADIPYCERHPLEAIKTNILGTINVAQAAGRHGVPLVFISTFGAKNPRDVYCLTKRLGEEIVLKNDGVVLRLSNIYGGERYLMKKNVVANFINAKRNGRRAAVHGEGSQKRDFIHVDDVCRAILISLKARPDVYYICTGKQTSILELAQAIGVNHDLSPMKAGYADRSSYGRPLPGWKPRIFLEEGLKMVYDRARAIQTP